MLTKTRLAAATITVFSLVTADGYRPTAAKGEQAAGQPRAAVVTVRGTTVGGGTVVGVGIIVDASGTVITALSTIRQLVRAEVVLGSGETYDRIRIRAFDERKDLAILKVPGFKLPTCVLGDSDAVKVGDKLTYFGSQALAGDSPSQTEVLASGIANGLRVLEVAVVPAAAGAWGPVLDASGQVVGVLNRRLPTRADTNLVVPINYARGMLEVDEGLDLQTLLARIGAVPSSDAPVAVQSVNKRPLPLPTLREAAAYGARFNSGEKFLDEALKNNKVKFAGAFSMDGTSKWVTFLTDWTNVAASAAEATKDHRTSSDSDLEKIPQGGLLHAVVEITARGLLNTGPATERFGGGRAGVRLKFGSTVIEPVSGSLVQEKGGVYFPVWTYMVGVYGNLGWVVVAEPGHITKKLLMNFAFDLDEKQWKSKGVVALVEASGKQAEQAFDFSRLR